MKTQAVVFDFDYTLGDSTDGIVICTNAALEQLGCDPVSEQTIRPTVGLTLEEMYAVFTGDADPERAGSFSKLFIDKAETVVPEHTFLLPGVEETLRRIHAEGIPIGIVTTKYHGQIEQILKRTHTTELVSYIVGADDVTYQKPDPESIWKILTEMNLDISEILYVGDSLVDAKTAQAAGADFAAVTTGTTTEEQFADYPHIAVMSSLQEVPGILGICSGQQTKHIHSHGDTDHEHGHTHGDTDHEHRHTHAAGTLHHHVHSDKEKKAVINRLSKSIGHLEAVKRMVENDRDCSDVLIQLAAVRSEINSTGKVVLKNHLEHCIVEAVEENDMESIAKMNEAIDKFVK